MANAREGAEPLPESSFATTHWSVVLAAGHESSPNAGEALEQLCRTYWYPLYGYVRRRGYSPEDAQDLIQEFFARLLARDYLSRADPRKGRFRWFLLAGLKNLLCDERDKARRIKRGGGERVLSLDYQSAEAQYQLEPVEVNSPDQEFERSWVRALLERASARLQAEYAASGRAQLFEQLTEFRLDAAGQRSYAEAARQLGLTESAVKSAIHRLRQRHGALVRDEIAQTLADPAEIEEEIHYLLRVVASLPG
jgi:RNA polymerase sigma factor (sigma-70 family)